MESRADATHLSAALLELEDQFRWEPMSCLALARRLEQQAEAIGDPLLATRARLCQANMRLRSGDVAGAARQVWAVFDWATEHQAVQLLARTHLVWANVHRNLGDAAQCLEQSVLSVELLDDTATAHMQIWHRLKLADALSMSGSVETARLRYRQSAELAAELQRPWLLMSLLNNWAHSELATDNLLEAQQVAARLTDQARAHGFDLTPPVLDTLGSIEIAVGRHAEGARLVQLAIERHGPAGQDDADTLAECHLTLAGAQRGLGAHLEAQNSLDRCRELSVERGLSEVLVRVHQEQAELYAARGLFAEAFDEQKAFFAAHQRLRSRQREAEALTRQAMFETAEARKDAERFREQARRDSLTGLHNRRYVDENLPALLTGRGGVAVAIADIDHFKAINDQLSHAVGDRVLAVVATLLQSEQEALAPDGFVARLGGEEFLLVLPGIPADAAHSALDQVRLAVGRHDWAALTAELPVTVSIGVTHSGLGPELSQPALLAVADRHLYDAKRQGRNRVVADCAADSARLRSATTAGAR